MRNFKCPTCVENGQTSRVLLEPAGRIDWGDEFYDEGGQLHLHKTDTTLLKCSNGHAWQSTTNWSCFAKDCEWHEQKEKIEPLPVTEATLEV